MENNKKGNVTESEQADLIELAVQLWKGKTTVLVCMVAALLLSVAYLATTKERWTSTAVVVQPDVGQVASYANTLFALYSPGQQVANTDALFPSIPDVQRNTFERFSALASALADAEGIDVENIKPPQQQPVYNLLPVQLIYTADSAEKAQTTLRQFIESINHQVVTGLAQDLSVTVASRARELRESLDVQEKVAQEQRTQYVAALNHALELAEQSGSRQPVSTPSESISVDTLYLLGSDALETLIQNESGRPLVLSDEYYKTREKLLTIEAIQPQKMQMAAFHYVMEPSESPKSYGMKKKLLILLIAAALGGMLGACIVLGRNAIRDYQSRG